jgi:hypothetical protein
MTNNAAEVIIDLVSSDDDEVEEIAMTKSTTAKRARASAESPERKTKKRYDVAENPTQDAAVLQRAEANSNSHNFASSRSNLDLEKTVVLDDGSDNAVLTYGILTLVNDLKPQALTCLGKRRALQEPISVLIESSTVAHIQQNDKWSW